MCVCVCVCVCVCDYKDPKGMWQGVYVRVNTPFFAVLNCYDSTASTHLCLCFRHFLLFLIVTSQVPILNPIY